MGIKHNTSEILGEIKRIDDLFGVQNRKRAIMAVALKVQTDNQDYPPETAANRPPAPFYIRGRGTQLVSGGNTGKSEQLLQRWKIRRKTADKVQITNNASYAGFVIGEDQTGFHRARGWPNVPDYLEDNRRRLVDLYYAVLQRVRGR